MSKTVHSTNQQRADALVAELFEVYRAAAGRAQTSHSLNDGIVAGHAWAAFLEVFTGSAPGTGGTRP